jgi:hypothetical protein
VRPCLAWRLTPSAKRSRVGEAIVVGARGDIGCDAGDSICRCGIACGAMSLRLLKVEGDSDMTVTRAERLVQVLDCCSFVEGCGQCNHLDTLASVAGTKRRLTALLLVPRVCRPGVAGSGERSYFRVPTPRIICSTARSDSGSRARHSYQLGNTTSRP